MTPVEWAALISAISVIVASSGSALLTYQITKRSIANDNDQRTQDREDNLMREYNLKLYESRVRVGVTYLDYLHSRNTEAIHCLSLASSGRGTEIVPNALGGLLSDAPIAGVLMFMPPHIRDAALVTEGNLREMPKCSSRRRALLRQNI